MTTDTLTDRYVHEVVRRIPAAQRGDVADELRATIADTVDARAADDPAAAEREVLTEMGDPIRLAAKYADRPLALIGPDLYPAYIRLLKLLFSVVLPIMLAVNVAIDVMEKPDLWRVFGSAIGTLFVVGPQLFAWPTLVYALIGRVATREQLAKDAKPWSPSDLPESSESNRRSLGAYVAAMWDMLILGLIVWQHLAPPYRIDGDRRVEVLDPALWSGWIWPILAGLAGIVTVMLIRATRPSWTIRLATWHAAAHAVFALPLAWVLYRQEFFNPAFLTHFNGDWLTSDSFFTAAAVGVLAISAIEVYKRFRSATQH